MPVPPGPAEDIRRVGRREYYTDEDNIDWSRTINSNGTRGPWKQVQKEVAPEPDAQPIHNCLWLVRNEQPTPQPFHWLLAVGPEDGGRCAVYQVDGDAVAMHYSHSIGVDVFIEPVFRDCYELAKLDANGEALLKHHANNEPPPQAENQALVRENCQDWTLRMLRALQSENVVPLEKIREVEALLDYNEDGRRNFG